MQQGPLGAEPYATVPQSKPPRQERAVRLQHVHDNCRQARVAWATSSSHSRCSKGNCLPLPRQPLGQTFTMGRIPWVETLDARQVASTRLPSLAVLRCANYLTTTKGQLLRLFE